VIIRAIRGARIAIGFSQQLRLFMMQNCSVYHFQCTIPERWNQENHSLSLTTDFTEEHGENTDY
jgi:hypothetical protein